MPSQKLVKQGEKQRTKIVRFVERYTAKNGYPPTIAEIGAQIGLASSNSVSKHLAMLEAEGRIKLQPGLPRSITVVK